MNQPTPPNGGPDVFGRTLTPPMRASAAPILPTTERPAAPSPEPAKATQQAGQEPRTPQTERAGTLAHRPSENITAERMALPATADSLRETRDQWMEGVRTTIRSNPLGCVAAALALGAVITRITR